MDTRRAYPGLCAAEPVWFQTEGTAPTEPLFSHRSSFQDETATRVRPPPRVYQPIHIPPGALSLMTSSTETPRTPQVAINDIGSAEDFLAAIDETIKYFNDGDIVDGTIVKVDRKSVV